MKNKIFFYFPSVTGLSLVTILLLATGGCGGQSDLTEVVRSVRKPFNLEKKEFTTGEHLKLTAVQGKAGSASVIFSNGRRFDLPVLHNGDLIAPVLPADFVGQSARIEVVTDQGTYESNEIRLQPVPISTSKPGVATLLYLNATIANVTSSIDELVTLSEDSQVNEVLELRAFRGTLEHLYAAILQAQDGAPVELSAPQGGMKYSLGLPELEVLDQYVMGMLTANASMTETIKSLSAQALPVAFDQRPAATRFSIATLNCAGLASPDDQAWCANMRTQIANDYIINAAGIVGTVGGFAAASLTALAAIGVAGVAAPAAIIGAVAIGTVVVANGVAGGVQGASAYGTGTTKGTNVRDNIKNLVDAARDFALTQIGKLFPNGGSDLIKEMNSTLTLLIGSNLFDRIDRLIADHTIAVATCNAQATSGGQGSFAHRYDFGGSRILRLDYDAFTVPDQFSLFDGTGQLGGTQGLVSGAGSVLVTTSDRFVTVKVNAPNEGTGWNYSIACAN